MRLLRHQTNKHSHVLESLIIIDLRNYTLIIIPLNDGLSDLLKHYMLRPMRVLYQTRGHTPYRLDEVFNMILTWRELEHLLTLFFYVGCGELFTAWPIPVVLTSAPGIMKKKLCY